MLFTADNLDVNSAWAGKGAHSIDIEMTTVRIKLGFGLAFTCKSAK